MGGRVIERDIGEVVIECLGEKATTIVVSGEEDDREVLGVYLLEGLKLEVDPVTRAVKENKSTTSTITILLNAMEYFFSRHRARNILLYYL